MHKDCATCSEFYEKNKRGELKCAELELGIVKKNSEYEALEAKFRALENEKRAIEDELLGLKNKQGIFRNQIGDEDDKFQLTIENHTLMVEKKWAESQMEVWKGKCTELELRVLELEKDLIIGSGKGKMKINSEELEFARGTPHNDTPGKYTGCGVGKKRDRLVKKRLAFDNDESPCKKIALSTPACGRPGSSCSVINICESHEKNDTGPILVPSLIPNAENEKPSILTTSALEVDNYINVPFTPTPKRKMPSNYIGTSDGEDDNCNVPKMMCDTAPCPLRESESENVGIPTTEDFESHEGSESDDSLKDFIVSTDSDDSASSASEDMVDGDVESDENLGFDEILSRIKRTKDDKMNWEYEGDMLAAFGKDPELCMKAVCALYRQQTLEEQVSKDTFCYNNRGFSKFDAYRGSTLAVFLTDGEPHGEVKKSVRELQRYDSKGVDDCRRLATHYSKQLFEIYTNKEDPFFLPLKR